MKRHIALTVIVLLIFLLSGCSGNDATESSKSAVYPASREEAVSHEENSHSSVYYSRIDDSTVSGFGGSDPILPEYKHSAVSKWLMSESTDGEILWFIFLAPDEKNIYILSHEADNPQNTSYWIYSPNTDTLDKAIWSDGRPFSEQTAQSNKYMEEHLNKAVIVPYLTDTSLKKSTKEELDAAFGRKPDEGDFGVFRAYEDYFVLFGTVRQSDDSFRSVLLFYSYEYELLGTETMSGSVYDDVLNDLRRQ